MKIDRPVIVKRIKDCGLIPIIRFEKLDQALNVALALKAAEVDIVEFPTTSLLALRAIEKISDSAGDTLIVGAGTVLDKKTARSCMLAGARFIVSPAVDLGVIDFCMNNSLAACPGALTPTEAFTAWNAGADFIKIFPCGSLGGVSYIQSLKTPFPQMPMVPVGGVTIENAGDFIKAGCPAIGVGTGIVDGKILESSQYIKITARASKYIKAVRQARKQADS